jgi:hypothetical protein
MNVVKLGIPYTVFEQDAAIDARPRDWSFGVYWAQTPLKECLPDGVDEDFLVENVQVDKMPLSPELFIPFYNSWTGDLLKPIQTPYSLRLQRRAFMRVLSQGLDLRVSPHLSHCFGLGEMTEI